MRMKAFMCVCAFIYDIVVRWLQFNALVRNMLFRRLLFTMAKKDVHFQCHSENFQLNGFLQMLSKHIDNTISMDAIFLNLK